MGSSCVTIAERGVLFDGVTFHLYLKLSFRHNEPCLSTSTCRSLIRARDILGPNRPAQCGMSCFDGAVKEYSGRIIVDHFSASNCQNGQLFFLSHCHKDHMSGLSCTNLPAILRSGAARGLFCSSVTSDLLAADPEFTHLRSFLTPLPYDEPTTLQFPTSAPDQGEDDDVTVTLLPAGHCPGSAMFLFEGRRGTVLCTGDLRLNVGGAASLTSVHGADGRVKTLDAVYLDTTFCHPLATFIPSRERSLEIVVDQVDQWLARGRRHHVCLRARTFGFEYMWTALSQRFDTRVHVSDWVYKCYETALPDVAQCLTTDASATRIHSCRWDGTDKVYRSSLPCGYMPGEGQPPTVLWIKLSTMGFARGKGIPKTGFVTAEQFCHVVHSMHSSLSELRDFVSYLKPRKVRPTVVPLGSGRLEDAISHLEDVLPKEAATGEEGKENCKVLERSPCSLKRQASWPSFYSSSSADLRNDFAELSPVKRSVSLGCRGATVVQCNDVSSASLSLLDDGEDELALPPKRRRLF